MPTVAFKRAARTRTPKRSPEPARPRNHLASRGPSSPPENLIEWPEGENEPTHDTLVTLPAELGLLEVVRLTKARWRVERTYEDLKGELGLDHYEGRSWVGWQHHVSAVLACYALVLACQRRAFPPRRPGRVKPVRSRARPAHHFADSFVTVRLAIARLVGAWLTSFVRRERVRRARARRRRGLVRVRQTYRSRANPRRR